MCNIKITAFGWLILKTDDLLYFYLLISYSDEYEINNSSKDIHYWNVSFV